MNRMNPFIIEEATIGQVHQWMKTGSLTCRKLAERGKLRTQLMKLFADHQLDALFYPHQNQLVCEVGGSQNERNGILGSVTGFPSICLQAGFAPPSETAPIGVPIGMEILGKPFSEATLIEISYGFEQATHHRKPPVSTPPISG